MSSLVQNNTKEKSNSILMQNYRITNEIKYMPKQIELSGVVTSGRGEGSFYMTRKEYLKQFQSELGYIPFPGTLNIKINLKFNSKLLECMDIFDDYKINGFSHEKRSFGWVKCFDAKLDNSISCHVIRLEKTHHDLSVVELISKHNIRITRNLFDGSTVNVTIMNKQN